MTGRKSSLSAPWKLSARIFLSSLLAISLACSEEPEHGGVVEKVDSWGLAEAVGIEVGDQIIAWRSNDVGGPARDPLELLWIEYDLAPRHGVTLSIERSGRAFEVSLEDSGWNWRVRPPLDSPIRELYRDLIRAAGDEADLDDWNQLEDLLEPDDRETGAWLAWRKATIAFDAGQVEGAKAAIRIARKRLDRPELRAALDFDEGIRLAGVHRFNEAIEPFAKATSTLAEVAPRSPLRAVTLSRQAAMLASQQRSEEAHQAASAAMAVIADQPRAHHARGQVTNNTGIVFHYDGDLEQAAFYYRQVVEELPGVDGARRATTGYNLGLIRELQGYYERANELLGNALAEAESLELPRPQIGAMLNALGILNKNMGAFEQASEYFRRSLEYFPSGGLEEADVRLNLGNLAVRRGLFAAAEEHLRATLEAYEKFTPDSISVAIALHNLGRALDSLERFEEAEEALRAALALEEELLPESLHTATTMAVLGALAYRQRNLEEAWSLLTRARALEERVSPTASAATETLLSLGSVALALGKRQQAVDLFRQGLETADRLRAQVPGPHGKARFSTRFYHHQLELAELLLEDGRNEEAFLTLERSSARMMRAMLQRQAGRVAMKVAPESESRRRQLDVRIRGILAELGQLNASQDVGAQESLREQLRALKVEREEITESLHRSSPQLKRIDRLPEVSIELIRRRLPPDSLGLSLMLGVRGSFLFLVSPQTSPSDGQGLEVFELPLTRREIESRVAIFRSLIDRGRVNPGIEKALVRQGARLFDDLLRPAVDRIESTSRLFIAPDLTLATLPFAALVRGEKPLRFLAEWKPHSIVPSLSSMVEISAHATERPEASYELVAIGDALFDQGGGDGALELDPLPGSRREVERIGELFTSGKKILLAAEATERAARAFMPQGRYVHFATHAILDRQFPLDSSLALALVSELSSDGEDGLLHAWEIVEGPALAADLVSLAGCETGLGARWAGEGLVGMVQAFHYVGVPNILASQWRVGDVWVGELTQPFYENLRSGQEPMEALASAQIAMIQSPTDALSHPFYWASFSLFGASQEAPDG